MELFIFLVILGLLSWGVAALATSRGRSGIGFFFLSLFLSPILGLVVVLVMKNLAEEALKEAERRRHEESRELERKREHEKQIESFRVLAAPPARDTSGFEHHSRSAISVADELGKLADLRDRGVLTFEEFDQQKRALLARSIQASQSPSLPAIKSGPAGPSAEQDSMAALIEQIRGCGYSVESPKPDQWEIRGPTGTSYASDENLSRVISELLKYAPGNPNSTSHVA